MAAYYAGSSDVSRHDPPFVWTDESIMNRRIELEKAILSLQLLLTTSSSKILLLGSPKRFSYQCAFALTDLSAGLTTVRLSVLWRCFVFVQVRNMPLHYHLHHHHHKHNSQSTAVAQYFCRGEDLGKYPSPLLTFLPRNKTFFPRTSQKAVLLLVVVRCS